MTTAPRPNPPSAAATRKVSAVAGHELSKRYGEGPTAVNALQDVSVEFEAGSFTAIMGPSGSGKSTLLNCLAGLERPTAGWSEIDGTRLDSLSDHDLTLMRRDRIGFIFQSYNLLAVLTAEENITLPVTIGGNEPDADWLGSLIDTTSLDERRDHRPDELSGGEQQRVAVARALISRPAVVFADEPTGNLDSASGRQILALLRRTVDELGQTIVMVTHDANAAAVADRVLFLADGRLVDQLEHPSVDQILDELKELSGAQARPPRPR
jgi:putative ABC transport system ATP-binding protein